MPPVTNNPAPTAAQLKGITDYVQREGAGLTSLSQWASSPTAPLKMPTGSPSLESLLAASGPEASKWIPAGGLQLANVNTPFGREVAIEMFKAGMDNETPLTQQQVIDWGNRTFHVEMTPDEASAVQTLLNNDAATRKQDFSKVINVLKSGKPVNASALAEAYQRDIASLMGDMLATNKAVTAGGARP